MLFPSLFVAALTVSASAAGKLPPNVAKTAKAARAASNGKSKPAPAPPQPQPTAAQPVVPLRPSQMPSVAPRVSYQQGMLTVIAENSTISDILGAIRSATGIRIESMGGPSGDRVAAKIGPARPREVLLSLLQGSRFDYVMLGAANDPERIERVILSPKLGAAPAPPPQAVAQQQQQQEPVRDTDQENDPVDLSQPDSEEAGAPPLKGDEPPPPDQQGQPQARPQPGYPQQAGPQNSTNPNPPLNQAQPNPQQQGQGQQGQEVKTPEQLLEELRMRQQQQQQQQQPQQYQQQPEQQQPQQEQSQPEQEPPPQDDANPKP